MQAHRGAGLGRGQEVEQTEDVRRGRRDLEAVVRSVSPSAVTQCAVAQPIERCVCRTAFGRPVVPELKTRIASSSSTMRSASNGAELWSNGDGAVARSSRSVTAVGPEPLDEQCDRGAVGDGVRRVREGQRVVDLRRLPRGAEEHRGGAELADGVDRDDELDSVRRHHRHPLAGPDTPGGQVAGERAAQTVEIAGTTSARRPQAGPRGRRSDRRLAPATRAASPPTWKHHSPWMRSTSTSVTCTVSMPPCCTDPEVRRRDHRDRPPLRGQGGDPGRVRARARRPLPRRDRRPDAGARAVRRHDPRGARRARPRPAHLHRGHRGARLRVDEPHRHRQHPHDVPPR